MSNQGPPLSPAAHVPTTPRPCPAACLQDEPFHVPQTQAYCAGRWGEWDPKITTFPGLYLVGVAWAAALRLVRGGLDWQVSPAPCSTQPVRACPRVSPPLIPYPQ